MQAWTRNHHGRLAILPLLPVLQVVWELAPLSTVDVSFIEPLVMRF